MFLCPPMTMEPNARTTMIPVPLVKQQYDFDCGYACISMISRWLDPNAKVSLQTSIIKSPWTIDLCFDLRKLHPRCRFVYSTAFVGVREDYEALEFYKDEMTEDKKRVSLLFEQAEANQIHIKKRILHADELKAHLDVGNVCIVLLDSTITAGYHSRIDKVESTAEKILSSLVLSAASLASFGSEYAGHYVVLCGYHEGLDVAIIRNPSFEGLFSIPWTIFDKARHAFGTDDDIIVVYNPANECDLLYMADFAAVPGVLAGSVACIGLDSLLAPALAHNIVEARTSFILCAVWAQNQTIAQEFASKHVLVAAPSDIREAVLSAHYIVVTLDSSDRVENFFRVSLSTDDLQGKVFLVLDTIPRVLSLSLHDYVASNGGVYLECPTIGSKLHAETLRLQIIYGGTETHFKDVRPLLCCFGTPKFVGPVGAALAIKFAHKTLAVMNLLGFASASAILHGLGADRTMFLEAIKASPFYVPTFTLWNEKMAKQEFDKDVTWTPFHLSKELNVILSEAKAMGIDTRLLGAARDILDETASSDDAFHDFTSVFNVIAANVKSPNQQQIFTEKQA